MSCRGFPRMDGMTTTSVRAMNLPQSLYREYTQPMLSRVNISSGADFTGWDLAETVAIIVEFRRPLNLMRASRTISLGNS